MKIVQRSVKRSLLISTPAALGFIVGFCLSPYGQEPSVKEILLSIAIAVILLVVGLCVHLSSAVKPSKKIAAVSGLPALFIFLWTIGKEMLGTFATAMLSLFLIILFLAALFRINVESPEN
jgi:chromate transport protein ChrA